MIYSVFHKLKLEKESMCEVHFLFATAALHTSGGAEERTPP